MEMLDDMHDIGNTIESRPAHVLTSSGGWRDRLKNTERDTYLGHICNSISILPVLVLALLLLGLAGGHGARVLFGCHGVGTRQLLLLGQMSPFASAGRGVEIGRVPEVR